LLGWLTELRDGPRLTMARITIFDFRMVQKRYAIDTDLALSFKSESFPRLAICRVLCDSELQPLATLAIQEGEQQHSTV
jgi:hypothetical protein